MNAEVKSVLCIIAVILVLILCIGFLTESDKTNIEDWAVDHNVKTESVEYRMAGGPFFHFKNTRIYKAEMTDGSVYWFRFGVLFKGMEVEQE